MIFKFVNSELDNVKKMLFCIVIGICLFALIHIFHFQMLTPEFVLKACVVDALLFFFLGYFFLEKISGDKFIGLASTLITFFMITTYLLLFPVMVDRSITVGTLLYLDHTEKVEPRNEVSRNELGRLIFYSPTVLNKRLIELEQTGNIVLQADVVTLSKKGKFIAMLYKMNRELLGIQSVDEVNVLK